jgi:hypothetical protein
MLCLVSMQAMSLQVYLIQRLVQPTQPVEELGGSQIATWCQVTQPPCQVTAGRKMETQAIQGKSLQVPQERRGRILRGTCSRYRDKVSIAITF